MFMNANTHPEVLCNERRKMPIDTECLLTCCTIHCSHEPGFRDLFLQIVGHDGQRIRNVELLIAPSDALSIARHVHSLNRQAWSAGNRPLDADLDESRPSWIDRLA